MAFNDFFTPKMVRSRHPLFRLLAIFGVNGNLGPTLDISPSLLFLEKSLLFMRNIHFLLV